MLKKPKLSIIIVHYRRIDNLLNCLRSIKFSKSHTTYEVIIVDNNIEGQKLSKHNLDKIFLILPRKVKYVKSPGNIGYGAGNNLGETNARGKYLFILNPDTYVYPYAIDNLVSYLDLNPNVAIVAPNLKNQIGELFPFQGSRELTPLSGIVTLSFINKIFPDNPIAKKFTLSDLPLNKLREAGAVPGSAFLIRKRVFIAAGKFDEKMFMYFEENDLGLRVKKLGYQIMINSNASVKHYGKVGRGRDDKLQKYFNESRFYYFQKHYGRFQAVVVELFAGFSKYWALLVLIVAIGAFLRFFRLEENLVFHGELGDNYLAIKNFIAERRIPILGPPTSHPWLSFGPLFYWLMAPILLLANFNPLGGAYFMALFSTVIIIINYTTVIKVIDRKTALVSSFLIAISPLFIAFSRESRFYSLVPLLFYPFFFNLVKQRLFWSGLWFGVMLNFHLSPIIFVPAILLTIYIGKRRPYLHNVFKFIIGLIVPSLPFIIYNLQNRLVMIKRLLLWIPYRVAGFLGLIPKNNLNSDAAIADHRGLYEFLGRGFFPEVNYLFLVPVILIIAFLVMEVIRLNKTKQINISIFSLLAIFFFGLIGIFIHGDPPIHYFLPLFPIPMIFISLLLGKLWEGRTGKIMVIIVITMISIINAKYYFSEKWFFQPQDKITNNLVPYKMQVNTAEAIIKDAKGHNYSLIRFGYSDNFEYNYAQNYYYLLWLMGNEPVSQSDLSYTIYEKIIPKDYQKSNIIFLQNNLFVIKNTK